MSLVEVDALHRVFRMARRTEGVTAVNRVSFSIGAGEAVGLVGESGSGKSTIARILVGLERADSGTATIEGVDCLTPARGRAARLRRARAVQMVFQDPNGSLIDGCRSVRCCSERSGCTGARRRRPPRVPRRCGSSIRCG